MPVDLWKSPAYQDEVRDWVAERLAALDAAPTGEWHQPHVMPWSSALSFESSGGRFWCKVNGVGTAHEPRLLQLLGERVPDLVPEVVAVDRDRLWSLTLDAGPSLREPMPADRWWDQWEHVVARYAEAQLLLSTDGEEVLAAGVHEVSPRTLPAQARALVADLAALPVEAGGLEPDDSRRLDAVLPKLERWCGELAESGVPDSVQHDDLHSGNVCWRGDTDGARIIDWGDASWGYPFSTMLATLNSVAWRIGVDQDAPEVLRVRDAYLEPFTAYADRASLLHWVVLARRVGCVTRALSWRAALQDATVTEVRDLEFPVRAWLRELL